MLSFVICSVFILIALVICLSLDVSGILFGLIIILFGLIGYAVGFAAELQRDSINLNKTENSLKFDTEKHTLLVKKRTKNNAKVLKMEEQKTNVYTDTPETLVYTGVTVGGVTTGGFHKEGGLSVQKDVKSGRFALTYNGSEIKKIQLTDELLIKAKESDIKKYLKRNRFVLIEEPKKMPDSATNAYNLGHKDSALNILENSKIQHYAPYEKCKDILDWICGVDK